MFSHNERQRREDNVTDYSEACWSRGWLRAHSGGRGRAPLDGAPGAKLLSTTALTQ